MWRERGSASANRSSAQGFSCRSKGWAAASAVPTTSRAPNTAIGEHGISHGDRGQEECDMTRAEVLRALVTPAAPPNRFYGVVVGVVTNNQDPDDMHRVKVRFPWLSKDTERVESNWARVAAPMTGRGRGQYFLPEVDDEVLVAFEHGQIDHPFVIGSLWNGQDTPPDSNADGQSHHRT